MSVEWWGWALFCAAIAVFLLVDLLVLHKDAHAVSWKEAAVTSAGWVALALAFGGFVWWWQGGTAAGEYFAGYLIEKSLSVDNLFVIALIFTSFGVPAAYQRRVLFWGVVGAIVFRAIFIGVGSVLLHQFHWMIWVFGALLVVTGVRMALSDHAVSHPENSAVLRWMRRVLPIAVDFHGPKFLVRHAARWWATPLLAVLVGVGAKIGRAHV